MMKYIIVDNNAFFLAAGYLRSQRHCTGTPE